MESTQGGGGGGGPAPFLLKTYEMVDDSSTNDVVSWSETGVSFVVWNPPDFAARLLPMYFKHNNFSSFIRQLNTYGFRKSDPERWEFSNEHFLKGQKQLLKSIHRRKPIHSHSTPPGGPQSYSDRATLEEEIDRLTRERTALQSELWRFKHQQSGTRVQIEEVEQRIHDMEQRQLKMVAFLHKAMANPKFMDNLLKFANGLAGPSLTSVPVSLPDPSSLSPDSTHLRKRRLPGIETEYSSDGCFEDHCSSSSTSLIDQSFCDKLKLELCPAMAAMSTHSSNEETDNVGPHVDSGTTSLCPLKSVLLDSDGVFPPHLDLTLASSSNMEIETNNNNNNNNNNNIQDCNATNNIQCNGNENGNGNENENGNMSKSQENENEAIEKEENAGPPGRVNDVFWEQFLTDKPGCDNEEASSGLRANPNSNPSPSPNPSPREEGKDMERLKL